MDDEIDLRAYLRAVLRQWKTIAALAALGLLIGLAFSISQPDKYSASAMVLVASPRYELRVEGVTTGAGLPVRTFPQLARSDQLISMLVERLNAVLPPDQQISPVRPRLDLRVETPTDPQLLRLSTSHEDPERAVLIANTWADLVAEQLSELLGADAMRITGYEAELESAEASLRRAEQALAAFQSNNNISVLRAQLDSRQAAMTDYLNRQHRYALMMQESQSLLARLEQQDPADPASTVDETTLLMLVAQASSFTPASLQFTLAPGAPSTDRSVADLMAAVRAAGETFAAGLGSVQAGAEQLQPDVLRLQSELAAERLKEVELQRNLTLAESSYLSLAEKMNDVRLTAQDGGRAARVASRATLARSDGGPSGVVVMGAGAMLGIALGVMLALALEWWRGPHSVPAASAAAADRPAHAEPAAPPGPART